MTLQYCSFTEPKKTMNDRISARSPRGCWEGEGKYQSCRAKVVPRTSSISGGKEHRRMSSLMIVGLLFTHMIIIPTFRLA